MASNTLLNDNTDSQSQHTSYHVSTTTVAGMATLYSSSCLKILIKIFILIFVFYGILIIYVNNSGGLDVTTIKEPDQFRKRMKYILQWSGKNVAPFPFMGTGNSAFIKNKCKYTNCFVTDKVSLLNLTDFDAIAFNGRNVVRKKPSQLPKRRSPKQKYIFGAAESAGRFPACNKIFDNFFNWTWTYKLSSNFRFGYITIYDLEGNVVGPAIDMRWPEKMIPISDDMKMKLSSKTKAVAWFVSHCKTDNKREDFVAEINKELNKFGWNVDIYGSCGKLKCPKKNWQECDKKLEKEYYFYFSFENSFAEDYVTEKVLTALNNYAVPVVFGSANYSRFLPPDSYLDARKLGAKNLARVIDELIANKNKYYDFFRWRNHFTYKQTIMNDDICRLCEVLNDEQMVKTVTVWKNFRKWWNGAGHKENC